jgi:hypothetical protein
VAHWLSLLLRNREEHIASYSALKMEAVWSSETLVYTYKSRWRYNPEDQHRYVVQSIIIYYYYYYCPFVYLTTLFNYRRYVFSNGRVSMNRSCESVRMYSRASLIRNNWDSGVFGLTGFYKIHWGGGGGGDRRFPRARG